MYDTDLNVTWVSDANLFASNSFGEMCCFNSVHDNGAMWYAAVIDRVFAMNRAEYLGASNWRVPTLDEFTHLFYAELGGTPGHSLMGNHGPFINIQSRYYSSTFVDVHDHCTFGFLFGDGFCFGSDSSFLYGWPVRNGDLSPVPEPTMWLWGSSSARANCLARSQHHLLYFEISACITLHVGSACWGSYLSAISSFVHGRTIVCRIARTRIVMGSSRASRPLSSVVINGRLDAVNLLHAPDALFSSLPLQT